MKVGGKKKKYRGSLKNLEHNRKRTLGKKMKLNEKGGWWGGSLGRGVSTRRGHVGGDMGWGCRKFFRGVLKMQTWENPKTDKQTKGKKK